MNDLHPGGNCARRVSGGIRSELSAPCGAVELDERVRLEREVERVDREIHELVDERYGLTEEEMRLVEEGAEGNS